MKNTTPHNPQVNITCPKDDTPILEFYQNHFESVYIIFHPFIKTENPTKIHFNEEKWPSKKEITTHCKKVSWEKFLTISNIEVV
jgi:hypothetical protein